MSFLRPLEGFIGVLHRLLGMLVPGLVIFFPVVYGGSTVRVCGEFVEIGSSLVRVGWHFFPSSAYSTVGELLARSDHCGIRSLEALHLLLQLRIHLIRDGHIVGSNFMRGL